MKPNSPTRRRIGPTFRAPLDWWYKDKDLAHVRGDALAKLPDKERTDWQKLWADVEALKKRCEEPPPAAKPPPKP